MFGLSKTELAAIKQSKSLHMALQIMRFASRPKGATVDEFLANLDVPAKSFHPRLRELVKTQCIDVVGHRTTKGRRTARVYRTRDGVTFQQYVQLRKLVDVRGPSEKSLSDVERPALRAAMRLVDAWHTSKRKTALCKFLKEIDEISLLAKETKHGIHPKASD